MRSVAPVFAIVIGLASSGPASAGGGHGHGHGHGNQPSATATTIKGAGQRLHFSFGGELVFDHSKLRGSFTIISHPLAPSSTRLSISCRYFEFKNATLAGPRLEFDAKAQCHVLETSGKTDKIQLKNHIVIVDNPDGSDQIDVEFIGETGIMISGGELSFGNFTFATGPGPA
jgi:hypothetical protein